MAKKTSQSNYLIALIVFGTITTLWYLKTQRFQTRSDTPTATNETTKVYKATGVLDFEITLPKDFQIEEKSVSVKLTNSNESIIILRSATNELTLTDYLTDGFGNNHQFTIDEESNSKNANGFVENTKIYIYYFDGVIYTLSTDSLSLYTTLDQIAQSFRYTPD